MRVFARPFLFCCLVVSLALSTTVWADDQPPTPIYPHSTHRATALGFAIDQPGVVTTVNKQQFAAIKGKGHQIVRGFYSITEDHMLDINGISVTTTDSNGKSASGIESRIVHGMKAGDNKSEQVDSRFVDAMDIAKLQQFVDTMKAEAERPPLEGDNDSGNNPSTGGITPSYQRNGKNDLDFTGANEAIEFFSFKFRCPVDVAVFKMAVDNAASWVAQQATH